MNTRGPTLSKQKKMKKKSKAKKIFAVYLHNKADSRDDMVVKVKALSKKLAKEAVEDSENCYRFNVGNVFTLPQLKKFDPEWHALLWGQKIK